MRLFAAVLLSEQMKDRLTELQAMYRRAGASGSYTPRSNMHLTLAFIGEWDRPGTAADALRAASFEPFELRLSGTGAFGDLWWAGIDGGPELDRLVRSVRNGLKTRGIPYDAKRFVPHVTLVRRAQGIRPETDPGTAVMRVERISLMKSERGPYGMIYTEIGCARAGGAD